MTRQKRRPGVLDDWKRPTRHFSSIDNSLLPLIPEKRFEGRREGVWWREGLLSSVQEAMVAPI